MCGIAGVQLRNGQEMNPDWLVELGLSMMSRGRDATGVALWNGKTIRIVKSACDAKTFFKHRRGIGSSSTMALIHTRAATHGKTSVSANNHPIEVGDLVGIHNGIIDNHNELFRSHPTWKRRGEVDSEAIFQAINDYGLEGLEKVSGSMAVAWLDAAFPGSMFLARGDTNPIVITTDVAQGVFFASTPDVFDRWKVGHRRLAEGEILRLEGGKIVWEGTFKPDGGYRMSWQDHVRGGHRDDDWLTPVSTYRKGDRVRLVGTDICGTVVAVTPSATRDVYVDWDTLAAVPHSELALVRRTGVFEATTCTA